MRDIGLLVERFVRTRTQSGKDADGRAFRPLSPAYAAKKRKAIGSGRADLTVSGRMLNEFKVTNTTASQVTVGFAGGGGGASRGTFIQRSRSVSGAQKAFYHNEVGAGRSRVKREFLGLTGQEQDEIEDAVVDFVVKEIKRLR